MSSFRPPFTRVCGERPSTTIFDEEVLNEFIRRREARLAPRTVRRDETTLRAYVRFIDCEAAEAEFKDAQQFLDDYARRGRSRSTIANHLSTIRALYKYLRQTEGLNVPYLEDLSATEYHNAPAPRRRYPIPRHDVGALIEAPESFRDRLLISFVYYTGVRREEVCNLKVEDVDTSTRTVAVIDGKNGKDRFTFYHASLQVAIERWLDLVRTQYVGSVGSDYFFVGTESEQLEGGDVWETVAEAADAAGIQEVVGETATGRNLYRVSPHVLRHSMATHSHENGMDLFELMQVLGHENLKTTLEYIMTGREINRRGYDKFQSVL